MSSHPQTKSLSLIEEVFAGGGEMGARMRALDWTKTPLGPVEQWPQSLKTSVSICLNSRFPVLVWWGPELAKIYNDAYAEIIANKHPWALGRPGREVWPEIWNIIGPMLNRVMELGEASWSDDLLLMLERKGYPEECYFTFSYSPIRDESGGVGGVFTPVVETTEKVLGRAAVEAERNRFRGLFQQLPAGILMLSGPEHRVTLVNGPYLELVGRKSAEGWLGKTIKELLPEIESQGLVELLDEVYRSGVPFIGNEFPVRLDRTGAGKPEYGYFNFVYQPVRDGKGEIEGILVHGVEVTNLIVARDRIRHSEALLELEKTVLGLVATGSPLSVALEELTRGIEARFSRRNLLASILLLDDDGVHLRHGAGGSLPEDYNRAIDGVAIGEAVGSCGTAAFLGKRVIVADIAKDPLWKDFSELALSYGLQACWSTPILGTSGKVLGTFAIYNRQPGSPTSEEMEAVDLLGRTAAVAIERKRVEERLGRSETQLRLITDALPDLISYIGEDGRYVRVNRAYEELFGRPASEFEGRSVKEVRGPGYARPGPHLEAALRGEAQRFESQIMNASGEARMLSVQHIPDRDEAGRVRGVVVQGHDITERKQKEEAVRESSERHRFVMEAMPQKIFTATPAGDVDYFNSLWTEYTGLTFEQIKDWGWLQFIYPDDVEENIRSWKHSIDTGEPFQLEHRFRRADGEYRWHLSRARALRDAEGKITMWTGSNTDIHDQKQTDEVLRQTEKLAVVGRMAATIAHEINNPLESVTNLLYLMEHEEGADLRGYARQAQEELQRVSHVVTHTLRFQRQSTSPTEERLSALMDSAIGIYQGRMKDSGVRLARQYDDVERVRCYASEMRQVFANLVGNAFDATRAGGEIVLRVRGGKEWKSGAKGVRVSIADTGTGMDAATVKRIFEPFFTTKGINGTGLGLWITAEILEKHKAVMRVKSSLGKGTVFSMWFGIHHGDTENTEKSG